MKSAPSQRFHDDEALLLYLQIDSTDTAWKSFQEFYRFPIYTFFYTLNYSQEQIKPIWQRALAEMLIDVYDHKLKAPLPYPLLEIILAYCVELEQKSTTSFNTPAGFTYLAKKVLVHAIKTGNGLASTAINNSFEKEAKSFIRSRFPKLIEEDLEEVFQDTMVDIWRKPPEDKGEREAKLFTYVRTVLYNKTVDRLKKSGKHLKKKIDLEQLKNKPEDRSHKNSDFWDYINEQLRLGERFGVENEVAFVNELLQNISENCRNLLNLKFFEGKKHREIAEIIGCSVNDVGQRVKRCLKKMKKAT